MSSRARIAPATARCSGKARQWTGKPERRVELGMGTQQSRVSEDVPEAAWQEACRREAVVRPLATGPRLSCPVEQPRIFRGEADIFQRMGGRNRAGGRPCSGLSGPKRHAISVVFDG